MRTLSPNAIPPCLNTVSVCHRTASWITGTFRRCSCAEWYAVVMTGDDVRKVLFHQKFRGYDPKQVDRTLDSAAAALDRGAPLRRDELEKIDFRLRLRGYNCDEVDHFLTRLADETR